MVIFIIKITATILLFGFMASIGYIFNELLNRWKFRKPYLKSDIDNICDTLTDFEHLELMAKIGKRVKWENIRPSEKEDFNKFITDIQKVKEYNKE